LRKSTALNIHLFNEIKGKKNPTEDLFLIGEEGKRFLRKGQSDGREERGSLFDMGTAYLVGERWVPLQGVFTEEEGGISSLKRREKGKSPLGTSDRGKKEERGKFCFTSPGVP